MEAPILVSGCARSGTSLVAQILKECGAWTGETVEPCPKSNPDGFFEHKYLRENVNKRILSSNDCDPLGVKKLPEPGSLQYPSFKSEVATALKREGYEGGPWLFKDAKLAYMPELWMREFPKARWVLTRRDGNAIVTSCLRTHFMKQHSGDPNFWMEWVNETTRRLQRIENTWGCLVVDTDKLVKGDLTDIEYAVKELGLTWDEEKVRGIIKPQHWKSSSINTSIPINTSYDDINANVESACKRDLQWLGPSPVHQGEIAIVGGGPSIKWNWKEIRKLQNAGVYVLALNGAYNFLQEKGIVADGMAMMDARKEINLHFAKRPREKTTFFISSQTDPAVFDALEDHKVVLWHNEVGADTTNIARRHRPGCLVVPPLGTTIGIRAMWLARALGFRKYHIFGLDSCLRGDEHHAYSQKQNDGMPLQEMKVNGHPFPAHVWMVAQVQDFQMWAQQFPDTLWHIVDCPPLEAMISGPKQTEKDDGDGRLDRMPGPEGRQIQQAS